MMLRNSFKLAFPRKVVSYYLLFCLVALIWLTVGMFFASHHLLGSCTTNACLSRLGRTAPALELAYLRDGNQGLQEALQTLPTLWAIHTCVVSYEGQILAHTDPSLLGQQAPTHEGSELRWGQVTGIQYKNEQNQNIHEYQVPLSAQEEHFGLLKIAIQQLGFWSTISEVARITPFVVLVPLGLVIAGALLLVRTSLPVAQIDDQLRNLALQPATATPQLQSLPAKNAVSAGWNRLVKTLQISTSGNTATNLNERLTEVLACRKQNQLQEVLHNLSDGIAVTDMEGRITFANRAITALLGNEAIDAQKQDELLADVQLEGQILQAAGSDENHHLFEDTNTHHPAVTEVNRVVKDDQRTLRVARLPLAEDSLQGHVWSVRDITQQKLAEKSRDQFIDAATHELRTPLSNIKAYAETLATCDAIEVEQQKEFCNIINGEVTRLARFVDDLLSISSMEAGSITIQRQRTVASRMFEEVLTKVQPLMRKKEIEFIVNLPEKMADLQIDKDKIVAVIVNLLGNAAKYTPEKGRVSLSVKLSETELQVAVEDTGVGIVPDEVPKVFEKFFRSEDPRVQAETGTGLGLSLAHEVIRLHGGNITVESQVDQGTTFTATIPIR